MIRTFIFTILLNLVFTEKVSFENYKVFRIIPFNQKQVEILNSLRDHDNDKVSADDKNHNFLKILILLS